MLYSCGRHSHFSYLFQMSFGLSYCETNINHQELEVQKSHLLHLSCIQWLIVSFCIFTLLYVIQWNQINVLLHQLVQSTIWILIVNRQLLTSSKTYCQLSHFCCPGNKREMLISLISLYLYRLIRFCFCAKSQLQNQAHASTVITFYTHKASV